MHKALSVALVLGALSPAFSPPVQAADDDKDLVHLIPKGLKKAGSAFKWLGKKIVGADTSPGDRAAPPPVTPTPTLPLGSDLNDLTRYDLKILPDAPAILESMQPASPFHWEWFASGGYTLIALDSKAATPALRASQRWRGPVAIQAAPLRNAAQTERSYVVAAAMLSTSATPEITFRRFKVSLARPGQPSEGKVIRVESLATLPNASTDPALPREVRENDAFRADVPASKMTFKISAGQKLRIFILKDEEHGFRFTYPMGVGGMDQGLDSKIPNMGKDDANLLTPMFENARLDRATIWSKRGDAKHFRNEPFLRVMKDKKAKGAAGWTAVGFHITIMGADYYNKEKVVQAGLKGADGKNLVVSPPEWLTRGFDSHGCMRLRRNDLRFVHDLALTSDRSRVIEVRVGLEAEPEHNKLVEQGLDVMTEYTAWPLEEKRYKRVKAFSAPMPGHVCKEGSSFEDGKPRYTCRDNKPTDKLTITEQMPQKASDGPVTNFQIAGLSADDRAHLARLFTMAEGRDLDPRMAPPPCLEEPCAEPVLPNLAEMPELTSDPSLIVDPVPAEGTAGSGSAVPAVQK